jgi:NADH-quinone oxidoreductase subunit L
MDTINAAFASGAASAVSASLVGVLLFIGATGKSAQIPLHVWLPDAMAGPTPVSALIHAATMVTAGVYLVARMSGIYLNAPDASALVAGIGAATAFFAATIAITQTDIKRVLAYSTVSQLGYMFVAAGVGAFAAGAFHLMTHAFFKALLFLGSGSVIHAMAGEQDMRRMGALRTFMPVTFVTMLIGTLAIAGIPPLSGFFSKDEILFRTFLENRILWALAALTALMTAFYMFRLMSMTFWGHYRGPSWEHGHGRAAFRGTPGSDIEAAAHGVKHPADPHAHGQAHRDDHEVSHGPAHDAHHAWHGPHEAPSAMTVPLMALAVGAIVAGFVGVPAALGGNNAIEHFLEPSFVAHAPAASEHQPPAPTEHAAPSATEHAAPAAAHGQGEEEHHMSWGGEMALMLLSVGLAIAGISFAWRIYVRKPDISSRLADRWSGAHRTLTNKYYVDELYDATVVRGALVGGRGLWGFDKTVVDGAVNGSGWVTRVTSWISGKFDEYVVDGLVNLVGWGTGESSFVFRRFQTGLIQNYALLMLAGVFVFLSVYLLAM